MQVAFRGASFGMVCVPIGEVCLKKEHPGCPAWASCIQLMCGESNNRLILFPPPPPPAWSLSVDSNPLSWTLSIQEEIRWWDTEVWGSKSRKQVIGASLCLFLNFCGIFQRFPLWYTKTLNRFASWWKISNLITFKFKLSVSCFYPLFPLKSLLLELINPPGLPHSMFVH